MLVIYLEDKTFGYIMPHILYLKVLLGLSFYMTDVEFEPVRMRRRRLGLQSTAPLPTALPKTNVILHMFLCFTT